MLDRETVTQIGVSAGAVGIFIAVAAYGATSFGTDNHLTETGGFVLVGGVALFVIVAAVAGLWLAYTEFEEDDASDDANDGAAS